MIDPQALRIAIEHHQARRHAEADAAYRECLACDPGNAMAWNNFTVLALRAHEWETALERAAQTIALAQDLPRLAALRASSRKRVKTSPLMDGTRFTRGVEAAFRTAWQQWGAG
jgi:Flp pilus assembly protein TadD